MQGKIILLNYPPHSFELKKEQTSFGYGLFQSATIKKPVLLPKGDEIFLFLKETSTFIVKTNIIFLNNWLENRIAKSSYKTKIYRLLLDKIRNNEIDIIQGLLNGKIVRPVMKLSFKQRIQKFFRKKQFERKIEDEQNNILIDFKKAALRQAAIYVWDKETEEFSPTIDYYEIIDHPAPAIGNAKDFYSYRGDEIVSYVTIQY